MVLAVAAVLPGPLGATPLHWVPVGPPGNPSITALAVAKPNRNTLAPSPPSVLFAATAGAGVFRSDASGVAWSFTGPGLTGDAVALAVRQFNVSASPINEIYETTIFAGTSGAGVFRLASSATSWVSANAGLASLDVRALLVSASGVVCAGTARGLFASADGGDSWSPKGTGLPSGADGAVSALAADPSAASTLYAGTANGLFKSRDAGETWSKLDTGESFKISVSTIAVDPLAPSRIYAAGIASPPCAPLCLAPSFLTALRSLDAGASWATMGGLAGNFVRAFAAASALPSRVFAGTAGNGVFESADGGLTWAASNDGLGLASVSSLVIDPVLPSLIFAGTSQGVFCAPLGQVAVTCASSARTLCLNAQRFSASVVWRAAGSATGNGQAFPITDNSGAFWFFDPTNLELVVKVLDGRSVNGKFWVFYGALTNVEYTLTVTDTLTGAVRTYFNPQGQLASFADTAAF
ncbi:MAG TPA: hypothetical protein VGS00_09600 [Thermoanaerobaculia bacterium]|nr:hypothetical protein [Thermoanaerobaculia bacterium]